jgi:hypothetical protein
MNNLLFSLAMAALGQFTGLGGGGFGGGYGSPGLGFGPGVGGPRYGGGYQGPMGLAIPGRGQIGIGMGMPGMGFPGTGVPSNGFPGVGVPGSGGRGGIALAPRPYGSQPLNPGSSNPTPAMQLASVTAAHCLEQGGQLAPGEGNSLLVSQGQARGWPEGWQQGISDRQVERLLSRYGGCNGLLSALRQGRFTPGQNGMAPYGSGANGGGLISQEPFRGAPPQGQPNSEAEAFGLAPYR